MNQKKKPMRKSHSTEPRRGRVRSQSTKVVRSNSPRTKKNDSRDPDKGRRRSPAAATRSDGPTAGRSSANRFSPSTSSSRADSPSRGDKAKQSSAPQLSNSEKKKRTAPKKQLSPAANAPTLGSPPKKRKGPELRDQPATKDKASDASTIRGKVSTIVPDSTDSEDSSDRPYSLNGEDVTMLGIGSPLYVPTPDFDEMLDEAEYGGLDSSYSDSLDVEMRIREIEERLEGLGATEFGGTLEEQASPPAEKVAPTPSADSAVTSAREVLESEYYRRRWGHGSLDKQSFDVDDFGMDPSFEEKLQPIIDFLYKKYFRVEVEGIRNVPKTGRAVIVANHSGALPLDGLMLRQAIVSRHSGRSDLRWLAEDFSFYLPFLGVAMNRIGAVRACPENAERLLERESLVGVFPEGAEGIKKLFRNRYRLQRFGRGGFVRLCLRTGSPIIPCAIVGAEETNPIFYRFDNLSKLLGLDYLPVTPTFPLLGPLGLLPAPTKWRIVFGEPVSVEGYGPQAAQDHVLVGRLTERVRASIARMLETSLRRRKSIWF